MGESIALCRRCLALKLERELPSFALRPKDSAARAASSSEEETPTNGLPPACSLDASSASNYFNGYQDGHLLFLAWQAANSVCVWDKDLLTAVQECEYVGHLVGGVLLIGGQPHVLATLTHAWSRSLLAAPAGYTIIMLGEICDCSAVRVPQGQFTPLADALCWVIHRLTKDGGRAEADAVRALLTTAFPNLNAPGPAHVHAALSNLIRLCKVYYSGRSYGIVQPHTYQVTAAPGALPGSSLSGTPSLISHQSMMNADDIVCEEEGVSHAAVQTDLAELINGASQPSDILITPKPGPSSKGSPFLERRLSTQAAKTYANRTASLKLSPTRAAFLASALASESSSHTINTYQAHDMTDITVRGERGSVLSKLLRVSPRRRVGCFSAQFPPPEWSSEGAPVVHLHSVATQTSYHKKQEESEWWWCSRVDWTPRSATLPRRLPGSQHRKASQRPHPFPAQVHMPFPQPSQHEMCSSLYISGSADQLLTESLRNIEPLMRSSRKRHPSPNHQSIHKHQSPVHHNTKTCKCKSQIHLNTENHKCRSSNHQNFEDKRNHKDNPVGTSPSRHDKPAITRNQLFEQLESKCEGSKGAAPTGRQAPSECRMAEKESRSMLSSKTSREQAKKSGQIIVKKLREGQKTDCPNRPEQQTLCYSTKGKSQKQQGSCHKTRTIDTHQTSCKDSQDSNVNSGDKLMQRSNTKSDKHKDSSENKEEKNQIMLDTEEKDTKQVCDTLHKDEDLENSENSRLEAVTSTADGSGRNYDRSSLQLDLGTSHMNNCRVVMSLPQRLRDVKNNMLREGRSLTDISKGSDRDVASRNMCYQEVDKCHKELCSETLEQVQQQQQQLSGSQESNSSSKHGEKSFSCNQYDNVIDKSQTPSSDETYTDTHKVSGCPILEGTSLSTYPSFSELNLNFQSLAAQKIVCGASINSIDTLLEVNSAAERCNINSSGTQSITNTQFGFL